MSPPRLEEQPPAPPVETRKALDKDSVVIAIRQVVREELRQAIADLRRAIGADEPLCAAPDHARLTHVMTGDPQRAQGKEQKQWRARSLEIVSSGCTPNPTVTDGASSPLLTESALINGIRQRRQHAAKRKLRRAA